MGKGIRNRELNKQGRKYMEEPGEKKRKHKSSSDSNSSVKSSSSINNAYKNPRTGSSPSCIDKSVDLSVSDTLRQANLVLFENSESNMDNSVFEPSPCNQESPSNSNVSQSTCTHSYSGDVIQYLQRIEQKISSMDTRLKKLDILEVKINNFETEIKQMRTYVYDSINSNKESLSIVSEKVESLEFDLETTKTKINSLSDERVKMEDNLLYMQSQSMRNNLIFTNITESVNEKPEESERLLRTFLVEKCQIAQSIVNEIKFERVHRMGRTRSGGPRDIVAKFSLFKDREEVRRSRFKLRQTGHFINEQYPKEISDRRRRLVPKMKAAIRDGKRSWISYDKLYVNGRLVRDDDGGH